MQISWMFKRKADIFIVLSLVVFCVFPSNAASADPVVNEEFLEGHQDFNGNRVVEIDDPPPPEMDTWTIAVRVRPTTSREKISLDTVTSIDFCDEKEIITSLGDSKFIYRNLGENEWRASKITVFQPHSITWSDSLQRYFVADTDNHRIISFAHLDKPFCDEANNPDCNCRPGDLDCQPYRETQYVGPTAIIDPDPYIDLIGPYGYMCRPHDLEYNPNDGYFYGVTAPYKTSDNRGDEVIYHDCGCSNSDLDDGTCNSPGADGERMHTYLFRFKDIDADGTVINGEFIDLKDLGVKNGRYTRAVTIGKNGRVYVVDSSRPNSGTQEGVYEIVNFNTSPESMTEDIDYYYYAYRPGGGTSVLNDVEYFNGLWYGTSKSPNQLFHWETWEGFPSNRIIEDLPDEVGSNGYFLTKYQGILYVAYYGDGNDGILRIEKEDTDVEIYVGSPVPGIGEILPPTGTILTNDQSGWHNDVLFGINPDPAIPDLSWKWAVVHHDKDGGPRTYVHSESDIEPDQWYHVAASSDGEELRLYIDGTLIDTASRKGAALKFNGVKSYIGANGNHIPRSPRYFQGDIAYIQMYDRTLSGAEILALVPPDCSVAYASPDCLWPPNHKFVDISIMGVTDPDDDPITITVTGITSDEATTFAKGSGGKIHAPDASGIDTDTASIRAERSGKGDGRVYVIQFAASDGISGECEGSVMVTVPHDQSSENCPAEDSGQDYDATQIN
jgi:hypothetical protein